MNHIHLIEIAFFENQLERACSYIEKYQSLHIVEYFFKKLKTYNPKLLANIYIQAVQKELEHTSNRSNYKRCTKLLAKVYPFASELILQCVKNLLSQYPTRTALKEELYLKF